MLIELEPGAPGTRFELFGRAIVKDESRRLAEATISTGATCLGNGKFGRPLVDPAAADFSRVRENAVPLLLNHDLSVASLIGAVEAAWIEGGEVRAILRYGTSPAAEAVWRSVLDDLPLRVSWGTTILDVEVPQDEDEPIIYSKWRLEEVSHCIFAKDDGARLRYADRAEGHAALAAQVDAKRALSDEQRRQAMRERLGAEAWADWCGKTAMELARQFAVPADALEVALRQRAAAQLDALTEHYLP